MAVITETTETEPLPAAAAAQALLENAANRRMCAGAYLDREFRDSVLREVYNDRNRRVAPPYGFNAVLGLRHARRARWLQTCQQILVPGPGGHAGLRDNLSPVDARRGAGGVSP